MAASQRKKRNGAQLALRRDVPPDTGRSGAGAGVVRPRKRRPGRPPSYRQRLGYDQAIVTLTDAVTKERRDYWLGEFDSRVCWASDLCALDFACFRASRSDESQCAFVREILIDEPLVGKRVPAAP